jgi:asparagine synthetase B (glutamine-hydrolysing)
MLQPSQYVAYLGLDQEFSKQLLRELESEGASVNECANGRIALVSKALDGGLTVDVTARKTIFLRDGDRGFVTGSFDARHDDTNRWFEGLSSPGSAISFRSFSGHGSCQVHVDWAGIYPVYVSNFRDGILLGNSVKLLQDIVKSDPDFVGITQFLVNGYCLSERTCLSKIQRLAPGQKLVFDTRTRKKKCEDTSDLWTGANTSSPQNTEDMVAEAAFRLKSSVATSTAGSTKLALMISGGWDSRTLLGELATNDGIEGKLVCYFHGDRISREASISQRLSEAARAEFFTNEILSSSFHGDSLREMFGRTGNVVFPHWHEAGRVLSRQGVDTIVSGVFGEIFGGHYGPSMTYSGVRQGIEVASEYLGLSGKFPLGFRSGGGGRSILQEMTVKRPWALTEEATGNLDQECAEDLAKTVDRLSSRGVPDDHRLIEAFISEHRGGQYISQQALSCRSPAAVSVPFGDREFLKFATCIPAQMKVHNRANRELLMRIAPELLDPPLAATLAPARYPVILQESSRVIRKIYESVTRYAHNKSRLVKIPRLGWANFESVRRSKALSGLAESLEAPLWRKDRILSACTDYEANSGEHTQPLVDMMMKVATVEFLVK